jgi:hypothetical protein
MPARVWPKITIAFYGIASVYLALAALGIGFLVARPFLAHRLAAQGQQMDLQVSPPLR